MTKGNKRSFTSHRCRRVRHGEKPLRGSGRILAEFPSYKATLASAGFHGNLQDNIDAIRAIHGDGSEEAFAAVLMASGGVVLEELHRSKAGTVDLERLIESAIFWGLMRERLFWKRDKNAETGVSIEQLALERKGPREAFAKRNEGRDLINQRRKIDADEWYAQARMIARSTNRTGGALEVFVRSELSKIGVHKSRRSIRRALNPTDK